MLAKNSDNEFKNNLPTKIRSKIIDIKRNEQEIKFIDDVIVENGDSSMLANEMIVIYEEKKQGTNKDSDIKRIDAIGKVKIFSEEFVATSKTGYYIPKNEQFVLEDDVIVNNGTSIASGAKFIYNLLTKKGRFIGPNNQSSIKQGNFDDRVSVIIGESDLKNNKTKKDNLNNE